MDNLIGLTEENARKLLSQTDKPIRCVYLTNRKQRRADTMLVVRARESETEIELVLSPFIMEQK